MTRVPFTPALLAVAALSSSQAMAGYTFEEGNLSGEATLTVGGATVSTRNVNFGAGGVDQRNGRNIGTRVDWQEFYLKPGVTLKYAIDPDFDLIAGGSVVSAFWFVAVAMCLSGLALHLWGEETHPRLNPAD